MNPTIQIQYRDVSPSPALTQLIQTELQRLARHHEGLTHCRVVISQPHQHQQHGRQFEVALELTTGLGHIVVNHHPSARAHPGEPGEDHTSAYATIRDVFDVARRKLDEQFRRVRTNRHRGDTEHAGVIMPEV